MSCHVIAMVNPKGGAGKTTLALAMAQLLSEEFRVAVVDGDTQAWIKRWVDTRNSQGKECPFEFHHKIVVDGSGSVIEFVDLIDDLKTRNDFIIIDVEGSANGTIATAISQSTLCLIPINAGAMDSFGAMKAIGHIQAEERKSRGLKVPYRIIFSRTNPIRTKEETTIRGEMQEHGLPVMERSLRLRAAFTAMIGDAKTFDEMLDDTPLKTGKLGNVLQKSIDEREAIEKAISDVYEVTSEVIRSLNSEYQKGAA